MKKNLINIIQQFKKRLKIVINLILNLIICKLNKNKFIFICVSWNYCKKKLMYN